MTNHFKSLKSLNFPFFDVDVVIIVVVEVVEDILIVLVVVGER